MMLKISIPEEYWGKDGWSLVVRFRGKNNHNGNFQIFNANIYNIHRYVEKIILWFLFLMIKFLRKNNGLELHLQQKHWLNSDTHDQYSFSIVADRLSIGDTRLISF